MTHLPREEYVEQAYMFHSLGHRLQSNDPVQRLLAHTREEILATTKLPMAIDYLLAELSHSGSISAAMANMPHYFTPFQTFLIAQAEDDRGRMDMFMSVKLLEAEARYRAKDAGRVGLFFFQFEILCRNRLSYDLGLAAIAGDPVYDDAWNTWLMDVRQKIGIVDLSDLIYIHSKFYVMEQERRGNAVADDHVVLFGEKEGRIALANRRKEPLYFFAALQRQLNYPEVPRLKPKDENLERIPKLLRTVERLETRVKLLEDEQRETGIDLSKFYKKPGQ